MATVIPPYKDTYGRASFEVMDDYAQNHLISGVEPPLVPAISVKAKNGTTLAQFTVVGYEGNVATGDLVIATATGSPAVKPIGVLAHGVTVPGSGTNFAQVWYSGCFDPTFLVWHASFNTDALKEAAFVGSATPTQIVVRKKFQ